MKILRTLLLLSLGILFFCCEKNDENDKNERNLIFNADNLKQTGWKGEITLFSNGKADSQGEIRMEFTTENEGICECKLDYFIDPETYTFTYEIKDKLMHIKNPPPYIRGGWILQKFDKDSLVIAQTPALTDWEIIKLKKLY